MAIFTVRLIQNNVVNTFDFASCSNVSAMASNCQSHHAGCDSKDLGIKWSLGVGILQGTFRLFFALQQHCFLLWVVDIQVANNFNTTNRGGQEALKSWDI